jgi:menaquinone-dependent protoporphyrinogen oxidase
MAPILVLYATTEGHTRRVAERVATALKARHFAVDCRDIGRAPRHPEDALAAVVLAPLRAGRHEPEIVLFVRRHRETLAAMRTAFLSIGLFQAVVEDESASPARREAAAIEVARSLDGFSLETGWHPTFAHAVAGALPYTHVNVLERLFLWWMARSLGLPDDLSRDHVLTDWRRLDGYVAAFAAGLHPASEASCES